MKITLIRHTRVAVESGICYGWTDVNVAHSFDEEAAQVKQKLQEETFDKIYSSPLSRCLLLAAYCGFNNPCIDERLKELHFGSWEMQKWENIHDPQLEKWYNDWIHLPAGGAESYEHQYKRVSCFLDEIKQTADQNICIFTHRGVIACAMVYAGLWAIENSFQEDIPYGSQTIIRI